MGWSEDSMPCMKEGMLAKVGMMRQGRMIEKGVSALNIEDKWEVEKWG